MSLQNRLEVVMGILSWIRKLLNDSAPAYLESVTDENGEKEEGGSEKDQQAINDFLSGATDTLSGVVFSAKVDGDPTCTFADSHKHDLDVMLSCCKEELKNSNRTGLVAAPFYFKRAAILAKKKKNYELEIKVCENLIASYKGYNDFYQKRKMKPPLNMSGVVEEMEKRIVTARKNIEKRDHPVEKKPQGRFKAKNKELPE
jgi:hypothetical protein